MDRDFYRLAMCDSHQSIGAVDIALTPVRISDVAPAGERLQRCRGACFSYEGERIRSIWN